MKRIFLVRHGEVDLRYKKRFRGTIDCDLSPRGVSMSDANVDFLLRNGIEKAITSPLKRARYVGEQLALRGIPHTLSDNLREADFGAWEGRSWPEIEHAMADEAIRFKSGIDEYQYPGGEAMPMVTQRMWVAWQEALNDDVECLALIGHSTSNSCLIAKLKGIRYAAVGLQVIGGIHEVSVSSAGVKFLRENLVTYGFDDVVVASKSSGPCTGNVK